VYSDTLELNLADVVPSLAGPKRPQDRVPLADAKRIFRESLKGMLEKDFAAVDSAIVDKYLAAAAGDSDPAKSPPMDKVMRPAQITQNDMTYTLRHGSVVIAAITSCTNTSNPAVMLGAGLVAKKAVERGLTVKPWVKTSLAPGSRGRHRIPHGGGASPVPGGARLPHGGLRLHDLHRQLGADLGHPRRHGEGQ
jgi:aconitate hydratase